MRRLATLLALFALVPVAGAAGGNPVVEATKRSLKARSATLTLNVTTSVPGLAKVVMTGRGAQRGSAIKLSVRASGGGTTFTMDAIGRPEQGGYAMYFRSPLFAPQLPPGKTWIRIDLAQQAASLGLDVSTLLSSSQSLAPLRKGLVATRHVGTETVAGRPATHYRAVVDLRRAARSLPAVAQQLTAIELRTGVRVGRVTQHVWVGADRRIRRLRTVVPTSAQGVRGTATTTVTYLAYDVPVKISAPPAAKVYMP